MPGFPQGQALVIGVGDYADADWRAPTAVQDAKGLAAALVQPAAAYDPKSVETLVDGHATRAGVLAALARLANRADPKTVALISLTCHGAQGTDGLYYLATADARFTADQEVVAGTGLSSVELARALREIPARHLILIVNACFAGRLGERLGVGGIAPETIDGPVGQMLPDEVGRELVNSGEGRAIITAGKESDRSYYRADQTHSFFGQALVDAFSDAAGTRMGSALGLFELYDFLYVQVAGAVRRQLRELQEPALTLLQGVGSFIVAGAAAPTGELRQYSQIGGAVREVPPITVNVTNKRSVISFDGATVMGDVRTGHIIQGDLRVIGATPIPPPEEEPVDPARRLPLLRARVEVARNVDEDSRDDAANKLKQAERALGNGDSVRARQRVDEALVILRTMNNGYVNSVVRKLEALLAFI